MDLAALSGLFSAIRGTKNAIRVLIGVGIIAAGSAAATSYVGLQKTEIAAVATARSQAMRRDTEQAQIGSADRRALCHEAFEYIRDDTPNKSLTPEAKAQIDMTVASNLEKCEIDSADDNTNSGGGS
jgi:hypothetical protein